MNLALVEVVRNSNNFALVKESMTEEDNVMNAFFTNNHSSIVTSNRVLYTHGPFARKSMSPWTQLIHNVN